MRKLDAILIGVLMAGSLFGQTAHEAIRYSNLGMIGTAKSMGMASAYGSLGGDFTGIQINPAVLGSYKSSEFGTSFGFNNQQTTSEFEGRSIMNQGMRMQLPNIHLVVNSNTYDSKGQKKREGWVARNFSVGYTTKSVYNYKSTYTGQNDGTVINKFLEELNPGNGVAWDRITSVSPFSGALAWEGYLINTVSDEDTTHYVGLYDGGMTSSGIRTVQGRAVDLTLSYSMNMSNKLLLGATVGLPSLTHRLTNVYVETDNDDVIEDFNSFEITESIATTGNGAYFQIGAIYQPMSWLRLGSSYKSPTLYTMKDVYTASIDADFNSVAPEYDSPRGNFKYEMYTPAKWSNSFSVITKKGLISVDWDRMDYGQAGYNLSSASINTTDWLYENEVNQEIRGTYGVSNNYRMGTEVKLKNYQALRFGYAYYGDPYKNPNSVYGDNSRRVYSLGYGKQFENSFFDIAMNQQFTQTVSEIYETSANDPMVTRNYKQVQLVATIGWRF